MFIYGLMDSLFQWSIVLSLCQYHTILITVTALNFEIRKFESSNFVLLFQDCFSCLGQVSPSCSKANFRFHPSLWLFLDRHGCLQPQLCYLENAGLPNKALFLQVGRDFSGSLWNHIYLTRGKIKSNEIFVSIFWYCTSQKQYIYVLKYLSK